MKTCLYCLSEVPDTAAKCKYCGEWLHHIEMDGGGSLQDLSTSNPSIHQAEQNVENVRLVWKSSLVVCIAAVIVLLFIPRGDESDRVTWIIELGCIVVVCFGVLAGALLSSVSHIVQLLGIILKNQLYRENHLGQKLRKLQQSLHE